LGLGEVADGPVAADAQPRALPGGVLDDDDVIADLQGVARADNAR
jgi:hypothetical protein